MTLELEWKQNELQIIYMEFNHYQNGTHHDNNLLAKNYLSQ